MSALVDTQPTQTKAAFTEAVDRWLDWCQARRRLAPSTVGTYRSSMRASFRGLPEHYTADDLDAAIDWRLRHPSASVRRSAYVIMSLFFRWWFLNGGPENPVQDVARIPNPHLRRRGLTDAEVAALPARLATATPKDRAIVSLLLHNGFRASDVVALKVPDVDFEGRRVRCRKGKGGTDTWLPLADEPCAALRAHMASSGIDGGFMFTGRNGAMVSKAIWTAWKRVAGPELSHLTAHQLRHTFATFLVRSGADINTVRRLMRHASLNTTQGYLDDDPDAEREAVGNLGKRLGRLMNGDAPSRPPQRPADLTADDLADKLRPHFASRITFDGPGGTAMTWAELAGWLSSRLERHPWERDQPRPPLELYTSAGNRVAVSGHTYGGLLEVALIAARTQGPGV